MTVKKIIYKIFIGLPRKIYFLILNFYREKLIVKYPNLFRFSSEPYITGDTFRNIADHVLDDGRSIDLKKITWPWKIIWLMYGNPHYSKLCF